MNIPQDPFILLSFINLKLRDEFSSFDELCKSLDLNPDNIKKTLKEAGFSYNPETNQFN